MSKTIVDQLVDRFLNWKLPEDFAPDDGIRFTRNEFHDTHGMPSGTNLLHAGQAKAMVEHMLAGVELSAKPLQFKTDGPTDTGYCEYTDSLMGFHIAYDPTEQPDYQFAAVWGEGETQHFRTMEEAKAWCQAEADGWIKDCGQPLVTA